MDELNKYLQELGLKYENLIGSEKDVYNEWVKIFKTADKEITVKEITAFIVLQEHFVSEALVEAVEKEDHKLSLFLASRAKNYKALRKFLTGPKKSMEGLKKQLEELSENKKS